MPGRHAQLWRPGEFSPMGKLHGKDPSVWMKGTRYHTYEGKAIAEGDFYLAHEEMVETIEKVLKFAVRDTPPKRAQHTATTIPVL